MRTTRELALIAVFTALLIGAQFAFAGISGVEIVTALLLSFVYRFGIRRGLCVANCFTLLRCFIFGFFPTVMILYLIYYNLFAVVFGALGNKFEHRLSVPILIILICAAVLMTVLFTAIDDVLTPLYFRYTWDAAKAYAVASLAAVIPQCICVAVTVAVLLPPLNKAFSARMFSL